MGANPEARLEYVDLETLAAWPRNPKRHDLPMLSASFGRFGFVAPVLVDETTGRLVAGHGRLDALRALRTQGQPAPARVRVEDGRWLIPVIRGIAFRDEREAEAYLLADNRAVELGGWDEAGLADMLKELAAGDALQGVGFTDADIVSTLKRIGVATVDDIPPIETEAEKILARWSVRTGDVWEIPSVQAAGRHRIVCGDALDCRSLIIGDHEPALCATDPPYGVSIVDARGNLGSVGGPSPFGGKKKAIGHVGGPGAIAAGWYRPIAGDQGRFDPQPYLDWAPVVVLFGAHNFAEQLPASRGWIVWDKTHGLDGTTTNFGDAELAWSNQDAPIRIYRQLWHGMVRSGEHERRTHPTQKPISLFAWLIERFTTRGATVVEPFAGGGSQYLAAESTGRICVGSDIEPAYVAVTLERLARLGLEPRRC